MKFLQTTVLLFFCLVIKAQFKEPKFGKIEMAEMTMTRYEKDTTAGALMLFDNGDSRFVLNGLNNFEYHFERHLRMKIFKKSAFPNAEFKIRLYGKTINKEKLSNLEAATFNLVDGKIVKTKLNTDNIYEDEGKNYIIKKFALPEVKEGSVIEVSYTISSGLLYNFPGWKFQHDYPALWSQYHYVMPEYYQYRQSSIGYLNFDINTNEQGTQNFNILVDGVYQTVTASTNEATLAIKDVPAFIVEPNIDSEDNYIQAIEFELNSINYPHTLRKDFTHTWESVNKEMNEDTDFGYLLKSPGFIKDTVEVLCANKSSELEKAVAIYNYVQNRMSWNNDHRIWANQGLKKPFIQRSGSSSEINLLLTLMLQTADLKANPVMFSTRDNGVVSTFYPTITKYNSTLSMVTVEDKVYLLDATNKYSPFGVLSANDLNGKGRVVNDKEGDWADLTTVDKHREVKSYDLTINEEGIFKGQIVENYIGYAASEFRDDLSHEKSNEDFIRKAQENTKGLTIKNFSITNKTNNDKPITDSLNVEISDRADVIGGKIIFKPMLFETLEKNHYTLEQRQYPIDYNFPISETYMFTYTLPQGYEIESMPQSISMKLPDNSISVSYTLKNEVNKIRIVYKRSINKVLFLPEEYLGLKELYDQIVKLHAAPIILKKTI